jgi:hypothetical protein
MTVTFQVESFTSALPDIMPLIDPHWEEVGSYKDEFRRDINYAAYAELEKAGKLLTVTAREDGRFIGYFIGVLGFDLHRVSLSDPPVRAKVYTALVYYVRPESRGHARSLTRAMEREAEKVAVQIVNIRVKPELNAADAFFTMMGYNVTEVTRTRLIGDAAHARERRPKVA